MSSTAVSHFVKAVGKDSFIPVPSLDVADNVKLLQVVVKKNRYWFWQKPSYLPSDFSLNDVLKDDGDVSLSAVDRLLVSNYNPSYSLSAVGGKFGADVGKELMHEEKSADAEVKLDVNFGNVDISEVDNIPKLLKALRSVRLDLNHPFVNQVRMNHNTLCLIVSVAKLTEDSELRSELKRDSGAKANMAIASRMADNKTKKFTIPVGTPIAYKVCELMITWLGEVQLVMMEGLQEGFWVEDDVTSPSRHPALPVTDESSILLDKGALSVLKEKQRSFTDKIWDVLPVRRQMEPIYLKISAIGLMVLGALVDCRLCMYFAVFGGTFDGAGHFLMIMGLFIFMVGFFLLCSDIQDNCICAVMLAFILILELSTGVAVIAKISTVEGELQDILISTQPFYKLTGHEVVGITYDQVQQMFLCCGVEDYTDWRRNQNLGGLVPDSCCRTLSQGCGQMPLSPQDIYQEGCLEKTVNWAKGNFCIVGAAGIGLAFVQIVGVVLAWLVTRSVKKKPLELA